MQTTRYTMNVFTHELKSAAHLAHAALLETLWPTRCALCDAPGEVLCARCKRNLPFLDSLRACPRCGAANGYKACTECNRFILDWKGLDTFPLTGCVSTIELVEDGKRLLGIYKDRGEQRLALPLAHLMAEALPQAWRHHAALVPIPARRNALRARGFDQIELIAHALSQETGLPIYRLLVALPSKDQRTLDARERLRNMQHSICLKEQLDNCNCKCECDPHGTPGSSPRHLIVIDDVFTTGATLFAAAEALRHAGAQEVYGLTFARA